MIQQSLNFLKKSAGMLALSFVVLPSAWADDFLGVEYIINNNTEFDLIALDTSVGPGAWMPEQAPAPTISAMSTAMMMVGPKMPNPDMTGYFQYDFTTLEAVQLRLDFDSTQAGSLEVRMCSPEILGEHELAITTSFELLDDPMTMYACTINIDEDPSVCSDIPPQACDSEFCPAVPVEPAPIQACEQGVTAISSCEDLQNMASSGDYCLISSFSCEGEAFTPIGFPLPDAVQGAAVAFSGSLLGNGYRISDLTIEQAGVDDVGLFSTTAGASISDLVLVDANVTGGVGVGSLIGRADADTTVTNVHVISTAAQSSTVTGVNDVGGLIGAYLPLAEQPAVGHAIASISSSSTDTVVQGAPDQPISNTLALPLVSFGGLVGYTDGPKISGNCSYGPVMASGTSAAFFASGGLIGYAVSGTIENSCAAGLVDVQADQALASLSGGLMGLVGEIPGSGSVPSEHSTSIIVVNSHAQGDVLTAGFAGGLMGFIYSTLTDVSVSDSSASGHVAASSIGGGLIGRIFVDDVSFKSGLLEDDWRVFLPETLPVMKNSGLAPEIKLEQTRAYGDVTGGGDTVGIGGLIGIVAADFGEISVIESFAQGDVGVESGTVDGVAGGLIGFVFAPSVAIERSCASGQVSAESGVALLGGFTGIFAGIADQATVVNSYALGNVEFLLDSENSTVGGFIGQVSGVNNINSYSVGAVMAGDTSTIGGFIGWNLGGATYADNFWDTQTSGQPSTAPGTALGKTTGQMQMEATFTNWDFTTTWDIDEGNGYPFLPALQSP